MSTRGKEFYSERNKDKDGRVVPVVKPVRMYQKNYRHQRNK